jgi:uncharacterized protein YabE (DUF348 family)
VVDVSTPAHRAARTRTRPVGDAGDSETFAEWFSSPTCPEGEPTGSIPLVRGPEWTGPFGAVRGGDATGSPWWPVVPSVDEPAGEPWSGRGSLFFGLRDPEPGPVVQEPADPRSWPLFAGLGDPGPVPADEEPATGPLEVVEDPPPSARHRRPAVWIDPSEVAAAAAPVRPTVCAGFRRPLIRAGVLAVLLALVAGGATALAMDKTVTVTVDGEDRVLHTYADDVAGTLTAAGLAPRDQDRVEPALPTDVADGDHIIVNRARRLTLVEGGVERSVWTTAGSVQDALHGLGVQAAPMQMSEPPTAAIPLTGMSLELNVPRTISLTDGTGKTQQVTTTASTVAGLLAEHGVRLGPDDVSVPPGDTALADGDAVHVLRTGVGEVVEVRRIPPPERIIEDPEMPRGKRVVVEKGKAGERTAILRVEVQNGKEVRREQVRAGGSTAPEPRVVRLGTSDEKDADEDTETSTKAPKSSDRAVWEKLAKCEATGNWSINTGNGYYGGLQFDAGTWKAYGGTDFAPLPHQASAREQMAVASKVRDDRGGYGAWPACSRKLGLPR